ncbi:glycosyltransferase family 4 protein [Candidatus Omnitrophota bacterium]
MKVYFILPYPTEGPSNRFRVEQYLPFLRGNNIEYTIRPFVSSEFYKILYKRGHLIKKIFYFLCSTLKRIADIGKALKSDLVFIHIEAFPFGPPVFEWLLAKFGKPLVFDFEDAVYLPKKGNGLWWLRSSGKFYSILRLSRRVIVCNEYLKNKFRQINPNITVIPTSIDTEKFKPIGKGKFRAKVTIGWIGSHSTFVYLERILPFLQKLAGRCEFVLKIVGAGRKVVLDGVEVISEEWSLEKDVENFQGLDIGIYPLPNDEWAMAKTPFKTVQYMSVGIPVVASRVGGNKEIIQDGMNGFLVSCEDEWVERLSALIKDPDLRRRLGAAGRRIIEEKYSLKVNAPRFIEALK